MPMTPLYPPGYSSPAYDLLLEHHKNPAQHDKSLNTLFSETVEDLCARKHLPIVEEANKVFLHEVFVDEAGDQLQGYKLVLALAKFMATPGRPVLYAEQGVFSQLYRDPAYRLYCGKYDNDEAFLSDIADFTAMIAAEMPSALSAWESAIADKTPDQAADVMFNLIVEYSA
ncbi:hypothetical protein SAMN03080615_01680 [Amphritea atlantica]|uniref:Uncharacterized protein n=1 Tax=Amphritea atlantica TaxID=355243 RepID=A0A1H9GHC3_9GAMM|nr:hypothetical protein [Amphritea atlantica]SEQ49477.1 hypothetical protein SAMN03080615_01680 [Amphritea atlantica]